MKKLTSIALALSTMAIMSCGDDKAAPDAPKAKDAAIDAPIDAAGFPAAPALGTQIDRMGRPAVNTALNALADANPLKTMKKDAYNHAAMPATWAATVLDPAPATPVTVIAEFKKYLGILDVLDQGSAITAAGCGNGALYNNPAGSFYTPLAGVLSNDELYVDTGKSSCLFYLSVEVDVIAGSHSQCGGRAPTNDVIDTSYSLLAAGTNGFAGAAFTPLIGDGVGVHADVSDSAFPFFGPPH